MIEEGGHATVDVAGTGAGASPDPQSAGDGESAAVLRKLLEHALSAADLANAQAIRIAEDFAESHSREQRLARELEDKIRRLQLAERQTTRYAEDLANLLRSERARRTELERALAQERLTTEELRRTGLQGISHLLLAASLKDKTTGAHLLRVRRYVEVIGERLGLPPSLVEEYGYSSVMHDIGKIHTPDEILRSPKELSPEEFAVVKQHCLDGEAILGQARFFETARSIARQHHERWDGEGYPSRLKGDEISLAARIVAVADVFDALTTERPYKGAWSMERGRGAILEGSGKQFDPKVIAAFDELYAEGVIERIRIETAEPKL